MISSFARDSRGVVFIYVTILLPALIGFGLLAIDGGRLFNLHTSLQAGADGFALAGAAELDRKPTAIFRANNAINTLVQNQSKFSITGLTNVTVASIRYLHSLPANDEALIDPSYETNDPVEARFVEVVVTAATLNTVLPAAFLGGASTVTTAARAVAGFTMGVCQIMPLFMCNPYEGTGTSIFEAVQDPAVRRQQIQMHMMGPGADYFPGNFAFLIASDSSPGANTLRDALAKVNPETCYSAEGVDTEPGHSAGPVSQGINVRFDIWDGPMNSKKNNVEYRSARTVRKGYSGATCAQQESNGPPDYMKLPRDGCFATDTCPDLGGGRMGDGVWPCAQYWSINFNGETPPVGCTAAPNLTRYEVYRLEIDSNLIANPSVGGETGSPMCSNSATSDTPDRRIIHAAIINCVQEGPLQGRETDVPVLTFAEFFITEPIGQGTNGDLYVELVRLIEPGAQNSNILHDIVQLYR